MSGSRAGTPRPNLRDRPERRYKGTTRTAKIETRATFVLELRADFPSLGYSEQVAAVRAKFECGETAAEEALARASERQLEMYKEGDPALAAEVATAYRRIAEAAEKDKKYNAARMAWDSLRSMLGLGVPDRMKVELADKDEETMAAMSDDDVAALARFEEARNKPTEH